MNAHQLAGILHLVFLCAVTGFAVRRLFTGVAARVCAGFLLIWADLAYTALLLSLFSKLANRWLYFSTSLLLALLIWLWITRRVSEPLALTRATDRLYESRAQRLLAWFLLGTLSLAAAGTLIICTRYYADNWDTLAYRFARVIFYLGQGNLLHFSANSDYRALTYPLNNALLYILPALYQFDGRAFNLISFVCWAMAALGVYFLARLIGASRLGALVASWLCAMAPIILCEGASTNDDLMAAVPMLLGVSFAYGGYQRRSRRCLLLAGLGVGLGVATKLHWGFFVPLGSIIVAIVCLRAVLKKRFGSGIRKWLPAVPSLLLAAAVAVPLATSHFVCDYLSTGTFLVRQAMADALNRPFRLDVAEQQLRIITAQLLLSPVADLPVHFNPDARRRTYADFDRWTNQRWFRNVSNDSAFTAYSYRFQGIADPLGYWYFEQTLWLGFLPLVMILFLLSAVVARFLPAGAALFFLAFVGWHLSFATLSRYMETICAYYSYPAVLTCAGFGLAWDALQRRKGFLHTLLLGGLAVVIVTHLVIDFNLLNFNVQRNLPTALKRNFDGETSVTRIQEPAIRAIQSANRINIPYLHWEVLYWDIMRHNTGAVYTTGSAVFAPDPQTLNILSISNDLQYMIGCTPGSAGAFTYLGTSSSGYLFGNGAKVSDQSPSQNGYFLLRGQVLRKAPDQSISEFRFDTHAMLGLERDSDVEFRIHSASSDGARWDSSWLTRNSGSQVLDVPSQGKWVGLTLEARSVKKKGRTCEIDQTTYPFSVHSHEEAPVAEARLKSN